MRRHLLAWLLALTPASAAAQFPAELAGRVIERGSALAIDGAAVALEGGARVTTDATGSFVLRSARDGTVVVRIEHPGYVPLTTEVELVSGRTVAAVYALDPAPIQLDALEVVAPRAAAGFVFSRELIERSGARTLGDLIRAVPGVVVRASASGERISIRGGSTDEVLVIVDGVAANDPLTGEADLSLVSLQGVESVRVLPGARSAQHGGRAQAGVVVVETRRAIGTTAAISAHGGTLGAAGIEAEAGAAVRGIGVAAGARLERTDGDFRYARPDALGGGSATRENAAGHESSGFAAIAGETWRVRADHARVERGLPGPVHAPTPRAGHATGRSAVTAGWLDGIGPLRGRVDAHGVLSRLRYRDDSPPAGTAYDDTTSARELGLRADVEHAAGTSLRAALGAGAELRTLRLESTTLEPRVVERTDGALFGRASAELTTHRLAPRLSLAVRADRWRAGWIGSHEIALGGLLGAVAIELAHRSAFTPPSVSDQFFGRGVAIEPNPDLDPERVRSELEAGATLAARAGTIPFTLGVSAYRADVDGMIVWAPDFRFVWSPRNRDVLRRGADAWLRADLTETVEVGARASVARVTYDWPGGADTVQVAYRPRYTGGATLDWRPGAWDVRAEALFTGVRYATPGPTNALPSYWDVDLALARAWTRGAARVTGAVRVQRLLDNHDSFIHGFPEPGRRLTLELSVRAAERDGPRNGTIQ